MKTTQAIATATPDETSTQLGKDGKSWPQTMDAVIWTQEWLKTIKEKPEIPTDEGTMIGWFANAIMAGYDEAARRAPNVVTCQHCDQDVPIDGAHKSRKE